MYDKVFGNGDQPFFASNGGVAVMMMSPGEKMPLGMSPFGGKLITESLKDLEDEIYRRAP